MIPGIIASGQRYLSSGDPYWANVLLLMHMDDTGLTDVKGNTVTINGNATRSATKSRFGGYSAYFDGSGDYLGLGTNINFNLNSGDFTVEFYVYVTNVSTFSAIIGRRDTSGYGWRVYIYNGTVTWNQSSVSHDLVSNGPASTISANAWNHVAVCRSGNLVTVYINGVGGTALNSAQRPGSASSSMTIGVDEIGPTYFSGYLDEIRMTLGVARYTANFTPPSAAFPES